MEFVSDSLGNRFPVQVHGIFGLVVHCEGEAHEVAAIAAEDHRGCVVSYVEMPNLALPGVPIVRHHISARGLQGLVFLNGLLKMGRDFTIEVKAYGGSYKLPGRGHISILKQVDFEAKVGSDASFFQMVMEHHVSEVPIAWY